MPATYLDSHSTTPVDPRVLDAMLPYFTERFGNASSSDHLYGRDASDAVQNSREEIAKLFGAGASEIFFTSGATESNNLAIKGSPLRGRHLVTCMTEHPSVLDAARTVESAGVRVTYLGVDEYGRVDPAHVRDAITDDTALVSIMFANNEVGTIHDMREIGRITRDCRVPFHTDAAQAAGHLKIDVNDLNIDMMSISAHKMYGPKGVGALYVRGMRPRVKLTPMLDGGGQERDMRPGTHNVPAIVGLAKAVSLSHVEMGRDSARFGRWTGSLLERFRAAGGMLNGHPTQRLPHNLNVRFPNVDGKAVINSVSKRMAISAGSACTTQSVEPSHVLLAMGLDEEEAHSSIRIGCGRFNTDAQIDEAGDTILDAVERLSRIRA